MSLLYREESYIIRGAAFDIYKQFRNRHKETVYQNALKTALTKKSLKVETQKKINIYYEDKKVGTYVPDLIIEGIILIELKVKPTIHQDDLKQFWHYLKNTNYKLGFLINFGGTKGVEIVRRVYDTARKIATPA